MAALSWVPYCACQSRRVREGGGSPPGVVGQEEGAFEDGGAFRIIEVDMVTVTERARAREARVSDFVFVPSECSSIPPARPLAPSLPPSLPLLPLSLPLTSLSHSLLHFHTVECWCCLLEKNTETVLIVYCCSLMSRVGVVSTGAAMPWSSCLMISS